MKTNAARSLAKRLRAVVYQGKPCRNGHPGGIRYTSNARCVECAKDDQAKQNAKRKAERHGTGPETDY